MPLNLDSLPFSIFPGLKLNVRGLISQIPDGNGRDSHMIYYNTPRTIQDPASAAADGESIDIIIKGNAGNNPMPNFSLSLSLANLNSFADSRFALSDARLGPIPEDLSNSLIGSKDIFGEFHLT